MLRADTAGRETAIDAPTEPEAGSTEHGPGSGRATTRAVEARLLREFAKTRDPRLKDELVRRLMPLARSLALRYRGGSEPLDDLVQVACLGLVKAIEGFDPERGRPFASYAVPTILGELRRHFRDHVSSVHLPRGLQERALAVRDAIESLGDTNGESPTVTQVAERLEITEEDVLEAMQAQEARRAVSLDAPRRVDDAASAPMIETVGCAENGYGAVDAQLAAEATTLEQRELEVLRLRFGAGLTQAEIGKRLGVSQMQISRVMRKALGKLLDSVADDEVRFAGSALRRPAAARRQAQPRVAA
ncbi:MAG: sigma-70 family RNA polymerase sigma factor [Solirubrobacterales bacterium]